ncbi:MAG: glycosyltransferase family 4 protein [Chitinophagaceae bacterium]|nr:glycosyltransferase family 4 protein [Chitinophagaceae bacterium]
MPIPQKKILFIGPHRPNRNGSQRFRMEQYFPYLEEQGFICDYSWFLEEKEDRILYSPGNAFGKLGVFMKAVIIRLRDVLHANRYDIIFIQREALMTGSVFFERQFSRSGAKVIFDFDDAIWLEDTSEANKSMAWLKRPSKTADIIKASNLVIAGNEFLADYARQFNSAVEIIPTVVDTSIYVPEKKPATERICIGWSGSKTTVKHFSLIVPVLKTLKEKYGSQIFFRQIGDKNFTAAGLSIESSDWKLEGEVDELNSIDIGLMPLPDDEWSKGKCGFKAIQLMALEIPSVVSPAGVNKKIIQHGENGFLASDTEDWIKCISDLIESSLLRERIGASARKSVEEKYSVKSQFPRLLSILYSLTGITN